jgi:hypothetical protein
MYRPLDKHSIGSMEPEELDSGPDFYAPQTMEAPDGRRILVAWMQNWDRSMPTQELGQGWAGSMTIPRELALRDGALFQWPVRELESLRRNRREYSARIGGGGNGADEVDLSRDQGAEGSEARAPEPRVTGKPEGHCLDLEIQFTSLGAGDQEPASRPSRLQHLRLPCRHGRFGPDSENPSGPIQLRGIRVGGQEDDVRDGLSA